MAMNSKGYVLTPVKDVMHVLTIVERVIYNLIQEHIKTPPEQGGYRFPNGFNYARTSVTPAQATAETSFTINGEPRTLTIYFSCDGDPVGDYHGKKLVLMMGFGDVADKFIPAILAKLNHLGKCLYDRGTLEDEPLVEITSKPMTFVEAVQGRFDYQVNFDRWKGYYHAVNPPGTFPTYFGMTPGQFARAVLEPQSIGEIFEESRATADSIQTQ